MKSELLDLEVKVHHRTDAGILVSDDGDRRSAVWLPLSEIEIDGDGEDVTITLPQWLAEQKELV